MNRDSWLIICLAYLVGLFTTSLFYFSATELSVLVSLKILCLLVVIIIGCKLTLKLNVNYQLWFLSLIIAILAVTYFYLRIPQPESNDISYLLKGTKSQIVQVTGKVLTEPRLNSSQKLKFSLQAQTVIQQDKTITQSVSGKLYVTVPLLPENQLTPRQLVTIKGILYQPSKPKDASQFNFAKYLQERGIFAGLTGWKIEKRSQKKWGWYRLRQRIIRAQVKGLDSPWGQLVSSMVLGRRTVDLPNNIRDLFIKNGLAHTLAASGFHVSLLLGLVLKLTNFCSPQKRLIIGIITLLIYDCLTGFSPSILRASLMGIAVLIAIVNEAKVKPLGTLLLAAVILLLINPLWIWDLSFQLSFLATLGLIVTLPILENQLDWLPSNLATLMAIPLAASLWTLPLIIYVFKTVATYSIFVNIITTPLIIMISLGGMITSAIALFFPPLASLLSLLLKYPLLCLITFLKFVTNLPGSNWAVGTISLGSLLIIYGLLILVCFNYKWQKKWWLVFIAIALMIIIPLQYQKANLLQINILSTSNTPSIIMQNRGKNILINYGTPKEIKYNVLPFLNSQGINTINYLILNPLINSHLEQTLSALQSKVKIQQIVIYGNYSNFSLENSKIPLTINSPITTKPITLNPLKPNNDLQLTINNQQWLITNNLASFHSLTPDVLIWLGKKLNPQKLNPSIKIAIAKSWEAASQPKATQQLYATNLDGTITWTPQTGFSTTTELERNHIID